MRKSFNTNDIDDLGEVARDIISFVREYNIILFYGEMGAGKTTLIKEICKELGVKDNVTSPTFAIVNEYIDTEGKNIYHFDYYRIDNIVEAYDMGSHDYFYSGNLCLIEWPEKVEDIIPFDDESLKIAKINIDIEGKNDRVITLYL